MKPRIFVTYAWHDNELRDDHGHGTVQRIAETIHHFVQSQYPAAELFIDITSIENDKLKERFKREINRSDFFLLFLSNHYVMRPSTKSEFNMIVARERELMDQDRQKSAPEETIFPRIYVIYMNTVRDIESPRPFNEVLRELQPRRYFDFRDLHMQSVGDSNLTRACRGIADIMSDRIHNDTLSTISMSEVVYNLIKRLPHFSNAASENRKLKLKEISDLIESIPDSLLFRGALVDSLLDSLISELANLSSDKYDHNISLNTSFLKRANPIFANADEVYAVSVDTLSSFWLSESSRLDAQLYTSLHPPATYRMFVFSSPYSMLCHRSILAEHHEQYGESGKVLFTTKGIWEQYLRDLELDFHDHFGESESDQSNWIGSKLGGDFGILKFDRFGTDSYIETILSKENLRFRNTMLPPFLSRITSDLRFPSETHDYMFGSAGLVHRWREEYADDDDLWYRRVAATFSTARLSDTDPDRNLDDVPQNAQVVHLVLFSRLVKREDFLAGMREAIPALMEIGAEVDRPLVQDLWYGRSKIAFSKRDEVAREQPIRIWNNMIEEWPNCLMIRFRSQSELDAYYDNIRYNVVRMNLYRKFSPALARLIDRINATRDGEVKSELSETLEELSSRYLMRLDFVSEEPTLLFRRIS